MKPLALAVIGLFLGIPLAAQTTEIAPLIGWQAGGSVEVNHLGTNIEGSPVVGLMAGFDRGRGRKLDIVFTHQQSRAQRHDPFEEPARADVSVTYLHIGGRYLFHPDDRIRPYIGATGGVTRFGIEGAHNMNLSFALGGGADIGITRSIALRLDGRFYVTWVNASLQVECDSTGACGGTGSGGSLDQLSATAGLVFRFQ